MPRNAETMDHAIELTPEGLRVRNWNTEQGDYEFEVVSPSDAHDLRPFLWRPIQISDEFKLKHLFELIDVKQLELLEFTIGENIRPYLEEAKQKQGEQASLEGLKYLEVFNNSFEVINGENSTGGFDISRSFHGYGRWKSALMLPNTEYLQTEDTEAKSASSEPGQRQSKEREYGAVDVDFIPTNQLLELPLRYDPELHLQEARRESGNAKKVQEFHTRIPITLIELLQAIFWEINLHGSPEQRDQTYQELNDGLQEALQAMQGGGVQKDRQIPELDPRQLIQSLEDELQDPSSN